MPIQNKIMNNIVAIVGRPNVGKSTFFNRLIQRREAIVDSVSGVTRDRNYGKSEWNGKEFSVIDTGGYVKGSDDIFEGEIRRQVELAIDEADAIVFVVDVEEGITPMDEEVAKLLRKVKKPILLVVNKVDNAMREKDAVEFYKLGLGDYFTISGMSGSGTGELLDKIVEVLPELPEAIEEENPLPRFCVVGRPNAGKSSFINALIGEDRFVVTDIAGTTRDAIDTKYNRFGFEFNLVDTAGIRRKAKVKEEIEKNREKEQLLVQKSKFIALGEMISNIAHQWRQPLSELSSILMFIKFKYSINALDSQTMEKKSQEADILIWTSALLQLHHL